MIKLTPALKAPPIENRDRQTVECVTSCLNFKKGYGEKFSLDVILEKNAHMKTYVLNRLTRDHFRLGLTTVCKLDYRHFESYAIFQFWFIKRFFLYNITINIIIITI